MIHIDTSIVSKHLTKSRDNKILRTPSPHISSSEETLPDTCVAPLLRTDKSPFPISYLHKVDAKSHPTTLSPLCNEHTHKTHHLFNCSYIHTKLSPWTYPAGVAQLLASWKEKLAGEQIAETLDSPI